MKNKLLLTLAITAIFGSAHAYDFSAVVPSGQTLYFDTVIGGEAIVTYPNLYYDYYYWQFTAPAGYLVIPDSIIIYGNRAYKVTAIGDHAFYNCDGLTSVTIPNSVTSIGDYAFHGCSGLTSVTIPNLVTSIGDYAFHYCNRLTSVSLPNSVTSIGDYTFHESGVTSPLYNSSLFAYMPNSFSGSYTIPDGITTICGGAFMDCSELLSVIIPESVQTIGNSSFRGCLKLTSAVIGNSVKKIGDSAFFACYRLMSLSVGESVNLIGRHAFYECGIIGELILPQEVISIGASGFAHCYGINKITCLGRVAPIISSDTGRFYSDYQEHIDLPTFSGLDSNIVVNIPCGSTNIYTGRWPQFHNYNERDFLFNAISEDINKGTITVESEPSCSNPHAVIRATPKAGYKFDHWSDGSKNNPYTYTVTGDITLIAYFSLIVGMEDVEGEGRNILVSGGRIVVEGAEGKTVRVYDMMGRLLATAVAGEAVAVPRSGVYLVKVGEAAAKKVVVL